MRKFILKCLVILVLAACSDSQITAQAVVSATPDVVAGVTDEPVVATLTPQPVFTSTPQSIPLPASYGPDQFPQGYNPLTGQPMIDSAWLKIPAVLLSVSHFPPVARPQAGFSFAPFIYEYYITEGSTRHLAVFYGEFPKPETPVRGDCAIRNEPFVQTKNIIGNRVWFDENQNGIQDVGENGVGGICVNLYDVNNNLLQKTTTDSNGYYAFNVDSGQYVIEVQKPAWLEFDQKNVGNENQDSDVDQVTGRSDAVDVNSTLLNLDAGLILSPNSVPPSAVPLPPAEVGPVRSGRLVYRYIGGFYQNSCLIFASADEEVLPYLPACATVAHTDVGGGAMLAIDRMQRIAGQNAKNQTNFNYASNLFTDEPPVGGTAALELDEYWALLNQSKWLYDAASGAWWRYTDQSNPATTGVMYPAVDRLNGRQLLFENVIVMFAPHIVNTPTIVDIDLSPGSVGKAYLFRDGQMYKIRWSTVGGDYEKKTGRLRPLHFVNLDGTAAALKPGHTWVIIMDTQSYLQDLSDGKWQARFIAPKGAK